MIHELVFADFLPSSRPRNCPQPSVAPPICCKVGGSSLLEAKLQGDGEG